MYVSLVLLVQLDLLSNSRPKLIICDIENLYLKDVLSMVDHINNCRQKV
jgi:hypothetical protein